MSFESADAAALNTAAGHGFTVTTVETNDALHRCMCIGCKPDPPCKDPARELSKVIEACDRMKENMTVWIDVQDADFTPTYVFEAIESLKHYGIAAIVTCHGSVSHGPGKLLPIGDCIRVAKANREGTLWHPYAKESVYTQ